ncbi:MAG: glucuronate isomerase [candidate division KSB1 bacterium]|nr:glucuronate isomerase [candidate division KSB1 bacterium]MDZ7312960.1 glucuronate isomerase [candidate division KSB1 bacterium]
MKDFFITENFLLHNETAVALYHDYAKAQPIIDYHCHLPPKEIAENKKFANLTQIWLYGDHYKWRAMRTNGVDERFITGNASDWEKFLAWAETVPKTLRNPLYHWTHMELKRPFGISDKLLNKDTAKEIWETCNAKLALDEFSTRGIMQQFNVRLVCTTDDPNDNLEYHQLIKNDASFSIKVLPAFRPDKGMAVENGAAFREWLSKLAAVADVDINNFSDYLTALRKRRDFFHAQGCRLSDHGIETAYAEDYTEAEIKNIFSKALTGQKLDLSEMVKFKSAMLYELGLMYHEKGWVQQYHLGALRNNNSRMFRTLGPDTGFDSIGDFEIARPLAKLLNRLDDENKLTKTILYNLNPRDNELMATMIGNFQDGSVPGKMQFGSAWWFLDQKNGIEKQLEALSNMGLLSRFIGMLTDSRSFLSYPRHDYFRRILCNMLGEDMEKGLIPNDMALVGQMVADICFNNANAYFGFGLGR